MSAYLYILRCADGSHYVGTARDSLEKRIAGAEKVGAHKTSMLQDVEARRPLELEAVVGAVVELGARLGLPIPVTQAVYACAKMLAEKQSREKG